MTPFRTILHPTDFSPGSAAAFGYACDLADVCRARVVVVYALGPVIPIAEEGVIASGDLDELRALGHEQLDAVRPADPAVRVERVFREGPAAAVILAAADECRADLIAMGTHGRTGFRRLVIGSVAEEVLRKSSCPVLTVKAPPPAPGRPAPSVVAGAAMAGAGI
jgi:nucleotide-binding universal stress UspA family protein